MIGRPTATSEETAVGLTVDWTRCVGHGVCAAAFGEAISLDRWGYPLGVDTTAYAVPEHLRSAARFAVASCPAAALRLSAAPRA